MKLEGNFTSMKFNFPIHTSYVKLFIHAGWRLLNDVKLGATSHVPACSELDLKLVAG